TQMRNAGIVEPIRDFRQSKFIIYNKLLGVFYFLEDNKIFDRSIGYFREKVGKVSITVIQFFGQINGSFHIDISLRENHIHDGIFYLLNERRFLIFNDLNSVLIQFTE